MAVTGIQRSCRWLALAALTLGACAGPSAVEQATTTPIQASAAATTESPPAATATANPADLLKLSGPSGMAFDSDGSLYVANCFGRESDRSDITGVGQGHHLILRFDQTGLPAVYAGEGPAGFSGEDGPALSARFNCPGDLAFDRAGNLYVADQKNFRVRRIDSNGVITTIAGSGLGRTLVSNGETYAFAGFAGDGGPATTALLDAASLAFDADGNLYVGDAYNNRVRKIDGQCIITTVVGNGTPGFSGDGGQATEAELNTQNGEMGIAFDAAGNLFIADRGNSRVRRVDRQGIITTFAGTGVGGFAGDGGPATVAQLSGPVDLAFDAAGSLYIADVSAFLDEGTRVRKIDQNGIITAVAGGGAPALLADGVGATSVWLHGVSFIAIDPAGDLLIADRANSRVRKVDQNGIITTVAGGGF